VHGLALLAVVVLAAFVAVVGPDMIQIRAVGLWSQLKSAPAPIYFGIMALALLAPVPASIFYVTAGPIYGVVASLLWIVPTLALNFLLVHMIASSWLRPGLESLITGRRFQIPRLETRSDQTLFITLIRLTPGIPYFVQNWLLALSGVDRLRFISISVAIQMLYATGFVVLGRSAFEGEFGLAVFALALLIVVSIVARLVHKRLRGTANVGEPEIESGSDESGPLTLNTTPLGSAPIIPPPGSVPAGGPHPNLNGPSLLRVPDWVPRPLGRYYLYYADHKGDRIRLAHAAVLAGPWYVVEAGALHLADTPFLQVPPSIPETVDQEALATPRGPGVPSVLEDCTIPHIASPDVIADEATQTIRLYYHGLDGFGRQVTRVAVSRDGLSFRSGEEVLAAPYLRMFPYRGAWYGLAMPGKFYRSADGLSDFEEGPTLFEPDMRHAGLWLRENTLWVFWTRVGDAPERILLSRVDLTGDWSTWRESPCIEVRRPTEDWEGAGQPITISLRSAVDHPVNQLRDPYFFEDLDGERYLVYAIAGESGLAIARLDFAGGA
jgi:uncharacterized membrane protein YdjX (TVP38/TMEM64 family)